MKKLLIIPLLLLTFGCQSKQHSEDYYYEEDGEEIEISNPYSEGSGHYAGYEWVERTGGSCDGNSQSFNEGCEEYYRQISQ
jgi:hypothetical protein